LVTHERNHATRRGTYNTSTLLRMLSGAVAYIFCRKAEKDAPENMAIACLSASISSPLAA